ncbi:hypothetical protein RhiirA4_463785 [Rhizophagus irregularis]|uniref:F-box domain-containing protein n=1 Tax=Rhizophagus irregularis TaxID=588596 RepID=A0A2I1GNM2_9GLOM|nr:hypothetical protein RhiirA4_463785 [Rhizophagus irregularis]
MARLNKDVMLLILEELQNDNKTLYSCLLVNRTWCKAVTPILWKNPNRQDINERVFFNVILSHLSEESRNNLMNQGVKLIAQPYQQTLFNYIRFWKYLDLCFLDRIMHDFFKYPESKIYIVGNEILNLFNMNTKFISIAIHKLSHIYITGTEHCFSEISELEYFFCDIEINSNVLERLAMINSSIKKLRFEINNITKNPGIIRLIETQKNLKEVIVNSNNLFSNEFYCKSLEESLINCADTIQYLKIDWIPTTNYLSYLVNLVSLKIQGARNANWLYLEDVFLPHLKILKARYIPSRILANLIVNTKGKLIEIRILFQHSKDNEKLIQAIYRNCPNLNYLQLSLNDINIAEFEKILIHCRFLIGLEIMESNGFYPYNKHDWSKLMKILVNPSSTNLFKFKFFTMNVENMIEALELFLDGWKDRCPIRLKTIPLKYESYQLQQLKDLLQMYKVKGIIKNYSVNSSIDEIECIQLIN